ncbi:unnamed protein product [Coffea canephora]|uniref:Uncharacterized protein n=1 Tax=Coffea canephora TaxID=49390 RepID=A0A068V877_COFCA|nr:unnamed protein product [Coffea canephora]
MGHSKTTPKIRGQSANHNQIFLRKQATGPLFISLGRKLPMPSRKSKPKHTGQPVFKPNQK